MRHRRRLNTQTIRKKQQPGAYTQMRRPQPSRSAGSVFKIFFYIIIFAALIYAGYSYRETLTGLLKPATEPVTESFTTQYPVEETVPEQTSENEEQVFSPIQKKIQVEVLNGCGEQGIAKILGDRLIVRNYDVVNSGNYIENGKTTFDVPETKIIDQLKTTENISRSKELAVFIGISTTLVESFENPSPIADITIVIGKDFKTLPVFKKD